MWERYCRGVNAIVFMVDAADEDKLEVVCETLNYVEMPDPRSSGEPNPKTETCCIDVDITSRFT